MKNDELWGHNFNIQPPSLETDPMSGVSRLAYTASVTMVEEFDNACVKAVVDAAREKGITNLLVLNKRAIVEALDRQTSKKPVENFPICSCPRCSRVVVCSKVLYICVYIREFIGNFENEPPNLTQRQKGEILMDDKSLTEIGEKIVKQKRPKRSEQMQVQTEPGDNAKYLTHALKLSLIHI